MATIKILDKSGGSNTSSVVEDVSVWDMVAEDSGVLLKLAYVILDSRKYIKNSTILQSFLILFLQQPCRNYFNNGPRRECHNELPGGFESSHPKTVSTLNNKWKQDYVSGKLAHLILLREAKDHGKEVKRGTGEMSCPWKYEEERDGGITKYRCPPCIRKAL